MFAPSLPALGLTNDQSQVSSLIGVISPGSTTSNSADSGPGVENTVAGQPTTNDLQSNIDPHDIFEDEYQLQALIASLWARIWAFEVMVPPWDDACPKRLVDERGRLVEKTLRYADFDVNCIRHPC